MLNAQGAVTGAPHLLLRLEGAAILALTILVYARTGESWWLFALLFFTPDLSMLGYLAGPRLGAICYNAVHTLIPGLFLAGCGILLRNNLVIALAAIWLGHIGFDHLFGYGLKYATAFGDTHLGRVGRKA